MTRVLFRDVPAIAVCIVLLGSLAVSAWAVEPFPKDEPLRDEFSLDAAVAYLDDAARTWQSDNSGFAA